MQEQRVSGRVIGQNRACNARSGTTNRITERQEENPVSALRIHLEAGEYLPHEAQEAEDLTMFGEELDFVDAYL